MRSRCYIAGALWLALWLTAGGWAHAQTLDSLSLESLLDQSVSAASKYEQTVAEAPASVTIITAEQIERYGYRSLTEMLGSVRGFYLAHDHVRTYLGARGFNRMTDYNNRTLLLLNGQSLNGSMGGSAPLEEGVMLDPALIERVEVIRGPGSVMYGTGAMFAVINVVTKQAATTEGFHLNAEYGNEGYLKSSLTFGKAFANGVQVFAGGAATDVAGSDLYYAEFDRPEMNDGVAEDINWMRYYGGHVRLAYKGWSAQGMIRSHHSGIPTADFGSLFNDKDARNDELRTLLEAKYERDLALDKSLVIRSFFSQTQQKLGYPFLVDLPALNLSNSKTIYTLDTHSYLIGAESIFRWDLQADNRLVIGAQFINNIRAQSATTLFLNEFGNKLKFYDESFPYTVLSLYAQDEYQVRSNLSLTLGLRQDFYSRTGSATTPRAALVYHPFTSTTFKLLYGEAHREPSTNELFFDGEQATAGIVPLKPNADLTPERIRTTELVWEQRLARRWTTKASLFNYGVRDLIGPALNPADSLFQFANVSRVEATGVELEVDTRLSEYVEAHASYSYQHTHQYDPDGALTNSPSLLFKTGLSADIGRYMTTAAEVFYESERRTVGGNTTDAYWLINAHLATKPMGNHWRLLLHVRNLLDATYYLPGSEQHMQDRFPQAGRQIHLRLTYTL